MLKVALKSTAMVRSKVGKLKFEGSEDAMKSTKAGKLENLK
jgi:hypothetical protein